MPAVSDRSDVHIEHIMPRELLRKRNKVIENSWQKEPGTRASEYSMFVNRIGNLTLLGSELNITASNYPFLEKKKI